MELLRQTSIYNNTLQDWLFAAFITGLFFILMLLVRQLVYRQFSRFSQKTTTVWDDCAAELVKKLKLWLLLLAAIYLGALTIVLPTPVITLIRKILIIGVLIQGAIWGTYFINFWVTRYKQETLEHDAKHATMAVTGGFLGRVVLWSLIVLLALDNLGFDITALVAGLGITGVAVALAVQNILGDLFASLSIVLDKPFVIGDFVIIDNFLGTIEHIGLKTTRIRSLWGEQLVFSNSDLLKSRIRNFKRMYERRVVFTIDVEYQTPYQTLEQIPTMFREIAERQQKVRFDRAHFKEFGAYALVFEIVYWINDPDYNLYMDIQQAINLEIFRRFQDEGIEFAYPTQSLYVSKPDAASETQPSVPEAASKSM